MEGKWVYISKPFSYDYFPNELKCGISFKNFANLILSDYLKENKRY